MSVGVYVHSLVFLSCCHRAAVTRLTWSLKEGMGPLSFLVPAVDGAGVWWTGQ